MLLSSREGYQVIDQITDYVSSDYEDALSLRQLESTGKILFEWNEIRYGAPMIEFDNQGEGEKNNFEAYFADPYADELIVCRNHLTGLSEQPLISCDGCDSDHEQPIFN